MIDTRNSYRVVPVKDSEYWRLQYRPWFWPFWNQITWFTDLDQARERAVEHAKPDTRKAVYFGRLPE